MSAPTKRPPEPTTAPKPAHGRPAAPNRVPPHQLTGAQAVVRSLEEMGVDLIFGIPGGAVLPVYDPLYDSEKLRHVLVRHEQGAGARPQPDPDRARPALRQLFRAAAQLRGLQRDAPRPLDHVLAQRGEFIALADAVEQAPTQFVLE